MHLVLHYFSQYDGSIPLVEELRAAGVRVATFQANIADSDAVRAYTRGSLKSSGTRTSLQQCRHGRDMLGIKTEIERARI